jgi:hypothetical protein
MTMLSASAPDAVRNFDAKAVDGRIRVGEGDQRLAAAGHLGEQLDLGGVGVGQLVDVDIGQPVSLGAQQGRVVGQQARGRAHQLGRVVGRRTAGGHVAQGQNRDVLPEEAGRGRPVVAAQALAQAGQLGRADAALGGALHQVA